MLFTKSRIYQKYKVFLKKKVLQIGGSMFFKALSYCELYHRFS